MASLASRSASLLPPRRVWRISKRSSRAARRLASSQSGRKAGIADLVPALHLVDHQLGVGDHAQLSRAVLEGPLQHRQQAGVFGVVVGLDAQELAQSGDDVALGVLDDRSVAGGAGIAARTAVAVGGDTSRLRTGLS